MVVAVTLAGCSSDKSSKASSTVPIGGVPLPTVTTTSKVGGAGSVITTVPQPTPAVSTKAPSITPTTPPPSGTTATTIKKTTASPTTTVPGRTVTSPSDNVKLGDSGPGVIQIQKALIAQGFKLTADGKFGAQTQTAVMAFQKKNGLSADGVVGAKTWAKLSASATTTTTAKDSTSTTVKAATTTTTIHH